MIFFPLRELKPFLALGSRVVRLGRSECSMLQSNPAVPEQSPSSWIQYTQTIRHRYVLFVFTVCSFFSRLQSGLSVSSAFQSSWPRTAAFKLDTVYSDSPSSLYSFCIYGVLGFFFAACSPGLVYLRPNNTKRIERRRTFWAYCIQLEGDCP